METKEPNEPEEPEELEKPEEPEEPEDDREVRGQRSVDGNGNGRPLNGRPPSTEGQGSRFVVQNSE